MDLNYKKGILYICKGCGEVKLGGIIHQDKCKYCGGEFIDTNLTEDEWYNKYYAAHPGTNSMNVRVYVIEDWMREVILGDDLDFTVREEALQKQEAEFRRIDEIRASIPRCPKCRSSNIRRGKRGFKLGRAIATSAITGFLDVGAAAGAIGSNQIINICNDCNHTWK